MESSQYVKMLDNNNEIQQVEQDRVLRFLDQGWKVISDQPLGQKKKSPDSMEYKMTVKAQVTSPRSRKKKKAILPLVIDRPTAMPKHWRWSGHRAWVGKFPPIAPPLSGSMPPIKPGLIAS